MNQAIASITQKYHQDRKPGDFVRGLGIPVTRQTAHNWRRGKGVPSTETVVAVLYSPNSETWARQWAGEVLAELLKKVPASQA